MQNTKIEPHFNCLQGEHVFIPSFTKGNGRDMQVTEFVCQHCLIKVDMRRWQNHLKYLDSLLNETAPTIKEIDMPTSIEPGEVMAIDMDLPPPKKPKKK